jgi:hypothetical protein
MLLQLYTKVNFELVHQHARQLKPVVYCQKNCCLLTFVRRQCRGAGGRVGGGVDATTEVSSRRKGDVFATSLPLQIRRRRPASGAAQPTTHRGAAWHEWSRSFFFLPMFSPSPQAPVGWARRFLFLISLIQRNWAWLFFFLQKWGGLMNFLSQPKED